MFEPAVTLTRRWILYLFLKYVKTQNQISPTEQVELEEESVNSQS